MTIKYEKLDELKTKDILTTSFVFERIDFRMRETAYKECLEKVGNFLLRKFKYLSLILFNIKILDNKVNKHLGIWNILEKKYKLALPDGNRSTYLEERDGYFCYVCKIDIDFKDVFKSIEALDKHRSRCYF